MDTRIETDLLGKYEIPADKYYGINTKRALDNFNLNYSKTNLKLIKEIALIKKAAAIVNGNLHNISHEKSDAIIQASDEIIEGKFDSEFPTDALQGGAGTSTNMNVNEVIANRASELLGGKKGEYKLVHPLNDVNMSQSTNDVYPTALKIAAIRMVRTLSESLSVLQEELQKKEKQFESILMLGRTELMDALPMTAGQEFGAYARCISRDRWRIYKAEERLREINLGGTAIGTGLNASLKYIYAITDEIQKLSGLGLSRSDYPIDTTQNTDVFPEISGVLKTCSVNLLKISNDLRFLSSGPRGGIGEIELPKLQEGSTIMPGKINPVICEMVAQISMKVMANDYAITMASSSGQLQLNAFLPLIADSLLESLELLNNVVKLFAEKCIKGLQVNKEKCRHDLEESTSLATALVRYFGYDKSSEIAKEALVEDKTIRQVLIDDKLMKKEDTDKIIDIYKMTKPGVPGKAK